MVRQIAGLALAVVALALAMALAPPPSPRALRPGAVDRALTSSAAIQLLGLQHSLAAADVVWLDIVQRLGTKGSLEAERLRALVPDGDLATDFDPRYYTVYYALASVLAAFGSLADESDFFSEKGRRHLPGPYQFPFMLGWTDYFIRGDAREAAEHWVLASQLEGAPHYLPSLAARARFQAVGADDAMALIESLLPRLSDEAQRQAALERMELIRTEHRLERYDAACRAFFEAEGIWPEAAGILHLLGYVADPPLDFLGTPITLDVDPDRERPCVARSRVVRTREFEARERIGQLGRRRGRIERQER